MRYLIITVLSVFFTLQINAQQPTTNIDSLEAYFEQALKDFNVPGMAIGIVKNDSIISLKGYGIREINKPGKVDENSLFAIASNSKTFTATAIAQLVEQGKISWDDKVINHLPYFELYDPYVTANVTIKDLLSHRTGLGTFSGDLIWYGSTHSREEIVRQAKYLKPHHGFREKFGYSNIMFLTAGLIIEKVSGMSWDEYMQKEFFTPLDMENTISSTLNLEQKNNYAMPHNDYKEEVIAIDYLNWDNIAPAGAIISSASDMCNWLRMHLNEGSFNDQKIVSPKQQREMWSPLTNSFISAGRERVFPSTHFKSYGMGWSTFDYHGKKIIGHNGGYDGMISQSIIIPEEELGFIILTNKGSGLFQPIMYKILDSFLCPDCPDNKDWSKLFLSFANRHEADKKDEKPAKKTKPSLELEAYTGTYTSQLYGDAVVSIVDKQLSVQFVPSPLFKGTTQHLHYDTFTIQFSAFPSLPEGTVNFVIDKNGAVEQMKIDVPNPDFDFTELEFFKNK